MKLSALLLLPTLVSSSQQAQHPLNHLPAMSSPTGHPSVSLADVLGSDRSLTTFSSLVRLHASTESLLADMGTNTTVLAPLNSAVDALPHKPWEDPRDRGDTAGVYEGEDGRRRAQGNLLRFVEGHLIPQSPWDGSKVRTVSEKGEGRTLWCEEREGKKFVMPDGVEVDRVAKRVGNGEIVSVYSVGVSSS